MSDIRCREHISQTFELEPVEVFADVTTAMTKRLDAWEAAHPEYRYDHATLHAGDENGNGFSVEIHGSRPVSMFDAMCDR